MTVMEKLGSPVTGFEHASRMAANAMAADNRQVALSPLYGRIVTCTPCRQALTTRDPDTGEGR